MFCHLKEVKQLRKVKMTQNLSPTLIATICGGLCSSNCMEEIEVISEASVYLFAAQHHTEYLFCK